MQRISSLLGILSAVILWPVLSWAQVGENYNIEIEGRYWNPKLDSTVKIVEDGRGTEFKAVNDLGFDERKDFWDGRLQIKFARKHKLFPLKEGGKRSLRFLQR